MYVYIYVRHVRNEVYDYVKRQRKREKDREWKCYMYVYVRDDMPKIVK